MTNFFGSITTTYLSDVNTSLTPAGVQQMIRTANAGGKLRVWGDKIAFVAASTAANDLFCMARLPGHAVVWNLSRIQWDDIGAATAKMQIGTYNPPNKSGITNTAGTIHNTGHDIASAGNAYLYETYTKGCTRLWEVAGASSDPKQDIEIWGKFITADVDADGSVMWQIVYSVD